MRWSDSTLYVNDLPKPTLALNPPYGVFLKGETVTLICRCQCPLTANRYYRDQNYMTERKSPKGQCETSLSFTAQQGYDKSYTCECLLSDISYWRSSRPSDPVQIVTRDQLSVPSIFMAPDSGAVSNGEMLHVTCRGDIRSTGGTFYLYKGLDGKVAQSHSVSGAEGTVTFTINIENKDSSGKYRCRYQTQFAGREFLSPSSKDVTITVKGAGKRFLLYVGLGCAAGIIVLLFVVLACFLISKTRKTRRQNTERSEALSAGVTIQETGDHTYDEMIFSSHPVNKRAEVPANDHQELTYATLNMGALIRNEAALTTTPDTSLYAEVKKK
ncbi:uncharacterized protein [Heptranchias perlo]|uniref:uncharacterized protein isoform X2 n=1 Tax=Heptranchias perlo TaxID=212740 RepID=UPI00355A0BA9